MINLTKPVPQQQLENGDLHVSGNFMYSSENVRIKAVKIYIIIMFVWKNKLSHQSFSFRN